MKKIVYFPKAQEALKKHRNVALRIIDKLEAYAADPQAFTNIVTQMRGEKIWRMRIGDYRVLFEETETEVFILDIAPRGNIYH